MMNSFFIPKLLLKKFGGSVPIPSSYPDLSDIHYLGGHSLEELIQAERRATQYAMLKAGRPSMTISLPEVNAFTLGQLLFMLEVQTAFTGGLYNIDPFDQPGVELGKKLTYGLMGRAGFEDMKKDIEERKPLNEKFVL